MKQNSLLTINIGSSSLKSALFMVPSASDKPILKFSAHVAGLDTKSPRISIYREPQRELIEDRTLQNHQSALISNDGISEILKIFVDVFTRNGAAMPPTAVVHRVVHGGTEFCKPVMISENVLRKLKTLIPMAPLHQPANILGIEATQHLFPAAKQIACFDTAFHRSHPWVADTYALPREFFDSGIQRFGFHGLSFEYIASELALFAPTESKGRVIVAHLGSGASMCALKNGQSIATTMGFSPLDGLTMGTRCGQIDPGVLLYLSHERKFDSAQLSDLLYHRSGLLGLSGISSDMRVLSESKDPRAAQAIEYFVQQALRCIGELSALLEGLDAIVFTGGIGENSVLVREQIASRLGWLGIQLDEVANRSKESGPRVITKAGSAVRSFVIQSNEEQMLANHAALLLASEKV